LCKLIVLFRFNTNMGETTDKNTPSDYTGWRNGEPPIDVQWDAVVKAAQMLPPKPEISSPPAPDLVPPSPDAQGSMRSAMREAREHYKTKPNQAPPVPATDSGNSAMDMLGYSFPDAPFPTKPSKK
jgi:hypothetical protein